MARILNPLLCLGVILIALLSLSVGSTQVSVLGGLSAWLQQLNTADAIIIGDIRLPRTLLALCVGAALGLSGAALQGLLRNPLADPSLTGASQGAALGAAIVFYYGVAAWAGTYALALSGLIGALITLTLMLWLSGNKGANLIILAGLAVSTITGALLAAALNFAPNPYAMQELVFWLLGSVANRDLNYLWIIVPGLMTGLILIISQRRLLLGLTLGENIVQSLGLSYKTGSRCIILGSAVLVGSAAAVAGGVGFVGLLVPHLMRPFVKSRPDQLLIPSMLAGAILVCAADIVIRLLPLGRELNLGVITALLGAPLFVWLVFKERKQWI